MANATAAPSTAAPELPVVYADVVAAAERLQGVAHQTPVMTSRLVNQQVNSEVFFKCENFQRTGSFKFRGAYNAIAQLTPAQRQRGVVAFSSGNHAQAVALAGQLLDTRTTIVMPTDAPQVKQAATASYGAEILLYDRAEAVREVVAQQLANDRGATIIPPYDHPQIIAGQGTAAKELIETVGGLDYLLVCCGGGGLLSGSAIATRALAPQCAILGVEPATADDATRSFHSGTLQTVHNPDTIADGARTASLGKLTFPLVLNTVNDMLTVTDESLLRTLRFLGERMKLVLEPTGVLAAAALIDGIFHPPIDSRVGVILSGGNVDFTQMGLWFGNPAIALS